METTAIQTLSGMDFATFLNLPSIIKTFDDHKRKAFANGVADKVLDREISDSEVDTVIAVVIDLAISCAKRQKFERFRRRIADNEKTEKAVLAGEATQVPITAEQRFEILNQHLGVVQLCCISAGG